VSGPQATAIVADDEPLLREELIALLARAWPQLQVVAQARNGREAVELFDAHTPDICFLDVHMPGMTGIEAAQKIGNRAHLVFVTAFERYALEAFEQGAHDYVVKPVDAARLATTVARLKERVRAATPSPVSDEVLRALAARLRGESGGAGPLRWIRASSRGTLRMIPVDDIDFLKSDEKYTLVAWRDEGQAAEALISTPLKQRAGFRAFRPDPPFGRREPALRAPRDARRERNSHGAPERARRAAAGEPQLPARVPADVTLRKRCHPDEGRDPATFRIHCALQEIQESAFP